jgi:RNA polymerase sigma factor (sigma-70 family)
MAAPMGNRTTAASAYAVTAVEPVIRRVVAARTANPADIDDLVQDCLERMLVASERLAPEAVLPYAVVVARNLVTSHAKSTMRHAAAMPRSYDGTEPERPGDALLARETRDAMSAALARLSDQERRDVLAYYSGAPAQAETAQSRGALRVRMARTRAKLRLEYLLAFRHLELPTPISHLSVAGQSLPANETQQSLRWLAGRAATASGATVADTVTRNGFWNGAPRDCPSYPALAGVTGSSAALQARQEAHLTVSTTKISVRP